MKNKMKIRITALLAFGLVLTFIGCGSGNEGKIVFSSRSESKTNTSYLYSMNPDGNNLVRLSYWYHLMPYHNIWSADGKILACVEYFEETGESCLSVVDTDTGTHRKLLDITDLHVESIALSPDGKTIVLSVDSTRVTRIETPEGSTVHVEIIKEYDIDLFTVNVRTGEMKRLTDTRDVMEKWPSFSPDGRHIVFVGRIDTETTKNVPRDVFIVDSDGNNRRLLAHHTEGQFVFNPDFRWSPDGTRIAYHLFNNSLSDNDHYTDVFVIDVKESILTNLTNSPYAIEAEPSWSPDNRKIAFGSGARQITIIDLEDGSLFTVNTTGSSPSWTPDGKGFIFTNSWNVFELVAVDADSSNLRTLAGTGDIRISQPLWLAD
jgi:Tol biopolymer transport system component